MNNLKDDFKDFLEAKEVSTPSVNRNLFDQVATDINPASFKVFSKTLLIHAITASVSLSICPQFGLQYFRHQPDLAEVFSMFGEYGCHLACGFTFMGGSLLLATLLLSKDEVRKLRQHRLLMLGSLTLISIAFFAFASPITILQGIGVIWALGAVLSGTIFLEIGWKLRAN